MKLEPNIRVVGEKCGTYQEISNLEMAVGLCELMEDAARQGCQTLTLVSGADDGATGVSGGGGGDGGGPLGGWNWSCHTSKNDQVIT